MKPLSILYVFMRFPEPTQTFAVSDVQELERQGHQISFLGLRTPHPNHQKLTKTYGLPAATGYHSTWADLLSLRHINWLAHALWLLITNVHQPVHLIKSLGLLPRTLTALAHIKKTKPDVVHLFWGHYPALLLLLVKKFLPEQKITIFLGAYDLGKNYPLTLPALNAANAVFTHARYNVDQIKAIGFNENINVIHRGIPIEKFPDVQAEKNPHQLCTVSALEKSKRVDLVIDTFAQIHTQKPDLTLLIMGDGPERRNLEQQVKNLNLTPAVTFTSYLPRYDVFTNISKSALFLFLSEKPSDRLPNVVKEAMLAGTPCVVSNTAGIDELITSPDLGHIVTNQNSHDIAETALQTLSNKNNPAPLQHHIRRHFSAEASMAKYLSAWRKICDV